MARPLIFLILVIIFVPLFLPNLDKINNWFRSKAAKEMREKLAAQRNHKDIR